MVNRYQKIISFFVACFVFLASSLPTTIVRAETDAVSTAPAASEINMQLKSGAQNGNSHFDRNATPEAFVLTHKNYGEEAFSYTLKLLGTKQDTRLSFVTAYVDDSHWAYIAYSGSDNNWFLEYKNGSASSYPGLAQYKKEGQANLFAIEQNDEVEFRGTFTEQGLDLTLRNLTKNQETSLLITDSHFLEVSKMAAKRGFGAGTYNSAYTHYAIRNLVLGADTYTTKEQYLADFAFYKTVEGQLWEEYVEPSANEAPTGENDGEGETTEDTSDATDDEDVEKWITLTTTEQAYGHQYEGASAPIVSIFNSLKTKKGDKVSIRLKPSSNFAVFYGYKDTNNWAYIGYDNHSKWYYQYKLNGQEAYASIGGLPEVEEGKEVHLSMSFDREVLMLELDGKEKRVTNQNFFNVAEMLNGTGRVAVKNAISVLKFTDVTLGNRKLNIDGWTVLRQRANQTQTVESVAKVDVRGVVKNAEGEPLADAQVRLGQVQTLTDTAGEFIFSKISQGEYGLAVNLKGYESYVDRLTVNADTPVKEITMTRKAPFDIQAYDVLEDAKLKIFIGKQFPFIARYESKENPSKYMDGNNSSDQLSTFKVNNQVITPQVSIKETSGHARTYTLTVNEGDLNFNMDVQIRLENNHVVWQVLNLTKNNDTPIKTLDFKDLHLLTIDVNETNTQLDAAGKSTNVLDMKDDHINSTNFTPSTAKGYLYAFLTNEHFSAGMYSNSEAEDDLRLWAHHGATTIHLDSNVFYYERGDKAGQTRTDLTYPKSDLPLMRISLAMDQNDDGVLDWNDGAIAYRNIQHLPMGSDKIKDLVNYRIAMNFAGHATNPYLKTADNIKRVHLATDGLPQAVMLKGYGNLGHDSANSEYPDIAKWQGGVEDFRKLIQIAHDYDTEIGIHINAQEAYPESKSFNETMLENPIRSGWGWLDQSFVIDKKWDLASQARYKRLVQLYDRINGTNHYNRAWPLAVQNSLGEVVTDRATITQEALQKPNNMDFIYLDVWYENAWETRNIAKEINSLGWRFSTEFSAQGEHDSTWQHWSTEGSYGGAGAKGLNSQIIRFIKNSVRDSQVMNYPQYGGAADNPLLGGYTLNGFEGWGGNNSFKNYLHETFSTNLPTRFLQHYDVIKWTNYGEGEQAPTGNIEKEIVLKNAQGDRVVVTRKQAQRTDHVIERIITLNGRKVLEDGTYLLPWQDKNGYTKYYHYHEDGGTTTWDVPAELSQVMVYELSQDGRINPVEKTVTGGQLTLEAKARVAYVVVPVANKALKPTVKSYGEQAYVMDPGFNQYLPNSPLRADHFTGDIQHEGIKVVENDRGDRQLSFINPDESLKVTTQLRNLVPHQTYVAYVYVNNQTDGIARLTVHNGEKEVSARAHRSTLLNYVRADGEKAGLNMNRMQVSFVAQSNTADLSLSVEEGEGFVNFDDLYVLPIAESTEIQADGSYKQDFENVAFGHHPFVLGPAEGINDPRTHLAEKHEPYTQKGFNGRQVDDVLDGQWSLKSHVQTTGLLYQTLPQTFYFEPGKVYDVEFEYQTTSNKGFVMVVGEGTQFRTPTEEDYLPAATTTTKHKISLVGAESGQSWIGIYERGSHVGNNWQTNNFILDNLVIKENTETKIAGLSRTTIYLGENISLFGNDPEARVTELSEDKHLRIEAGKIVGIKAGTTTVQITLSNGQQNDPVEVTILDQVKIPKDLAEIYEGTRVTTNTQQDEGEGAAGGHAEHAFDGRPNTHWHSQWSGHTVSENNPAWLNIAFPEAQDISGFTLLQRTGNINGLIYRFKYEVYGDDGQVIESKTLTVPQDLRRGGQTIPVDFDQHLNAKQVKIIVLEGGGNFASIAEVRFTDTHVMASNEEIRLPETVELNVGERKEITVEVPDKKFPSPLSFSVKPNEDLIKVNERGILKGLKPGKTFVTVSNELGFSKVIAVTVLDNLERLEATTEAAETITVALDKALKTALGIKTLEVTKVLPEGVENQDKVKTLIAVKGIQLDQDVSMYDIALKNEQGERITKEQYSNTPNFEASVKVPLLSGRKLLKIFYLDVDAQEKEEVTKWTVVPEEQAVEFKVKHFSHYALVYEPKAAPTYDLGPIFLGVSEKVTASNGAKQKDVVPNTGATADKALLGAFVLMLAVVYGFSKKNKI